MQRSLSTISSFVFVTFQMDFVLTLQMRQEIPNQVNHQLRPNHVFGTSWEGRFRSAAFWVQLGMSYQTMSSMYYVVVSTNCRRLARVMTTEHIWPSDFTCSNSWTLVLLISFMCTYSLIHRSPCLTFTCYPPSNAPDLNRPSPNEPRIGSRYKCDKLDDRRSTCSRNVDFS